jgi:hypothetical protein
MVRYVRAIREVRLEQGVLRHCCVNPSSVIRSGQSRSRPVVSCSSAVAFRSRSSCYACAGTASMGSAIAISLK